jgi:hypothetical protein
MPVDSKRKDQAKFSYSKVDTFAQCGFKYKLKYVDGFYVNTKAIALDVGNLIHGTEEDIANMIKAGEPIDYIRLKNNIIIKNYGLQHDFRKDYDEPDKVGRLYKDKIAGYLDSGIYRLEKYMKYQPDLEIVAAELPFDINYKGWRFAGKIDRVLRNKATGKYIVQDIKTYPVEVEKEHLETPLQFVVYTLAMKEMFGVSEADISCAYDLPFCDVVQTAGTDGYMARGLKELDKLLEGIDKQDFKPNPTPLCHWCEYCATNPNQRPEGKNKCPYHSLWTKDNKVMTNASVWLGMEHHDTVLKNYIEEQAKYGGVHVIHPFTD